MLGKYDISFRNRLFLKDDKILFTYWPQSTSVLVWNELHASHRQLLLFASKVARVWFMLTRRKSNLRGRCDWTSSTLRRPSRQTGDDLFEIGNGRYIQRRRTRWVWAWVLILCVRAREYNNILYMETATETEGRRRSRSEPWQEK